MAIGHPLGRLSFGVCADGSWIPEERCEDIRLFTAKRNVCPVVNTFAGNFTFYVLWCPGSQNQRLTDRNTRGIGPVRIKTIRLGKSRAKDLNILSDSWPPAVRTSVRTGRRFR
jgi:hypothetical protein